MVLDALNLSETGWCHECTEFYYECGCHFHMTKHQLKQLVDAVNKYLDAVQVESSQSITLRELADLVGWQPKELEELD